MSSIFLKVCSTWTMYVPVETVNSWYNLLYTNHFFVFMQIGVFSLISMGTTQNVHEYIEYSQIIHFHHKKGGADMFKALQHIKAKSYKLRMNLVDFGGTAQKEQLVYLARGAMSMSELMANPAHSTTVGI